MSSIIEQVRRLFHIFFFFFFFFLPCPVFYPVCLFSRDVHVQLLHQRFGGRPGGMFGFPFFAIITHPTIT